jgi:peptidoglycan hydrolase-like protein with peptidoglycan-binding domain
VNKSLRGQGTGGTEGKFKFGKTLKQGSKNNDVAELQKWLAAQGFFKGEVTGYFGAQTKAAVIECQKKNGLDAVGIVGPKTRDLLNK